MRVLAVRLDEARVDRLDEIAKSDNVTVSHIVREAIDLYQAARREHGTVVIRGEAGEIELVPTGNRPMRVGA